MPVKPVYDYLYPNVQSYKAMGRLSGFPHAMENNGRGIQHGYLFGYVNKGGWFQDTINNIIGREVNYGFGKRFQFNPASLAFNISMTAAESADVEAPGGNLNNQFGAATTDLKIWFDRTQEVSASLNGNGDPLWRALGVQKDIDDLFRILTGEEGEPTQVADSASPFGEIFRSSTSSMTRRMFDAASGGSGIGVNPVAIIFNSNLAVHVNRVSAFAFTYTRFTRTMVPTTVAVDMSLEIASINTAKTVTGAVTPATQTANGASPGGTSPGSGATSSTRTPANGTTAPTYASGGGSGSW